MRIKAVCFDLHGTLVYVEKPVSERWASDFLVGRGYEVYPQALDAAWHYVSFVDYPRFGYRTWRSEIKRVLQRLDIKIDKATLKDFSRIYEQTEWTRFPDVIEAVNRAKKAGLKTAIVTTIARFKYKKVLRPILGKMDVLADGYTFHCEKSNPRIYVKTLEALGVKAHETVMIGDGVELGILVSKKLGMKAILLDRAGVSPNCGEADAVVRNLNEAIETLKT